MLQFIKVVFARFFVILFRKRKRIDLLYLNYETEQLFENSYIIIRYRFRNALWFRFENHSTIEKQIKIFDLNNIDKELTLTVFGFFNKKEYKLKFAPKLTLDSNQFKTSISKLSLKLYEQDIPNLAPKTVFLKLEEPKSFSKNIKIKSNSIQINTNSFNQNEFI